MSPRARRLAGSVHVEKMHWQGPAAASAPARPVEVRFATVDGPARTWSDAQPGGGARELELPSLTAQRREAIEREAYAEGYAKGTKAAEIEGARRLEALRARLTATIADVSNLRPGLMRRAERELVRLAISIAERIVRREIEADPELLLVMARVAIDRLGERAAAVVHLHPDDYAGLTRGQDARIASLDLVADPAVPPGGCLIASAAGEIDAGIDAQIRELSRELLGVNHGEDLSNGVVAGL